MSFELKPDQSLGRNIRRLARKQMNAVLEELTGPRKGPRDEAVHEARKSFKKDRAVLRLARPAIGRKTYRAQNACFRDAGRPLWMLAGGAKDRIPLYDTEGGWLHLSTEELITGAKASQAAGDMEMGPQSALR